MFDTKITVPGPELDILVDWLEWMDQNVGKHGTHWHWYYVPGTYCSEMTVEFANEADAAVFCLRWDIG